MQHLLARVGGLGIATLISVALTIFVQAGAALVVTA
jgi:hypothetical protein